MFLGCDTDDDHSYRPHRILVLIRENLENVDITAEPMTSLLTEHVIRVSRYKTGPGYKGIASVFEKFVNDHYPVNKTDCCEIELSHAYCTTTV